ncbi:DUF739 domain-containing protein [Clostridium butyricum]|uniref:DUF739 domain-containing protein n=1 Tax=Clostridium butyricum TaxID=1492 RepID=UPI00374F4E01
MIMVNELKILIEEKGYSFEEFSKILGISNIAFNSKFNEGIFGSDEIEKMRIVLDIKNPGEIFFNKSVTQ